MRTVENIGHIVLETMRQLMHILHINKIQTRTNAKSLIVTKTKVYTYRDLSKQF